MLPVGRDGQRDGIGAGHRVAFGKIETLEDLAAGGIDQQNIVRKIAGDQEFFRAGRADDCDRRGKRDRLVAVTLVNQARLVVGIELLEGQLDKPVRGDLSGT